MGVFHVNTGVSHSDCRLGRLYRGTTDQNLISQFTSVVREPHLLPRLFLAQALTTFFFSPPSFTSIVLQFDASSRRRFFLLGAVAGALLLTVKKDLLFTWPAVSCSCTLRGPFVLACRRGSLSAVSMYFCKRTQDTFPHYGP